MSDSKTLSVYNKQIDAYVEMAKELHEEASLTAFISKVPPKGHVLDLGCGPGTAAAIMKKQGLRVDAVDASEEMVRVAKTQFGVDARCAEFSDINQQSTYDGIWANFSLLHATPADFPIILSALHLALKPTGVFHLGMKLGDGTARDELGRFYSYYSEQKLQFLLIDAGFRVLDMQPGEGRGLAGNVEPWILVLSEPWFA